MDSDGEYVDNNHSGGTYVCTKCMLAYSSQRCLERHYESLKHLGVQRARRGRPFSYLEDTTGSSSSSSSSSGIKPSPSASPAVAPVDPSRGVFSVFLEFGGLKFSYTTGVEEKEKLLGLLEYAKELVNQIKA